MGKDLPKVNLDHFEGVDVRDLRNEIAYLRGGLEYYADEEMWANMRRRIKEYGIDWAYMDNGKTARNALNDSDRINPTHPWPRGD